MDIALMSTAGTVTSFNVNHEDGMDGTGCRTTMRNYPEVNEYKCHSCYQTGCSTTLRWEF
ncbi:hypothetical protein [Peribacillus loiseleuriae]|uniref:hypothetical protein n=1 Tax=Peribacillus loiseleuriae TaxID=1679170 RepID=UPI000A590B74|nr:hypothetical protein [Peribacillus loiseleuriae]